MVCPIGVKVGVVEWSRKKYLSHITIFMRELCHLVFFFFQWSWFVRVFYHLKPMWFEPAVATVKMVEQEDSTWTYSLFWPQQVLLPAGLHPNVFWSGSSSVLGQRTISDDNDDNEQQDSPKKKKDSTIAKMCASDQLFSHSTQWTWAPQHPMTPLIQPRQVLLISNTRQSGELQVLG